MKFEDAVEFVLLHEGNYSDDPSDPGGQTKWGISKRSYPDLDIPSLTREAAIDIYRRDYWDKCRCGELPSGLDLLVFDSAVNQGTGAAVRMLQQACKVSTDGIIGGITIRAACSMPQIKHEFLARRMFQYALVPQVHRYGLGWYRRVSEAAEKAFQVE